MVRGGVHTRIPEVNSQGSFLTESPISSGSEFSCFRKLENRVEVNSSVHERGASELASQLPPFGDGSPLLIFRDVFSLFFNILSL